MCCDCASNFFVINRKHFLEDTELYFFTLLVVKYNNIINITSIQNFEKYETQSQQFFDFFKHLKSSIITKLTFFQSWALAVL